MRRAVSVYLAALFALVKNYIAFFRVYFYLDGLHLPLTLAGSVAGIYIKVKRPKTKRAVISRCIAERLDLSSAVGADKSVVVF